MNGFIKLHRKITKWEWYQDANTFRLFLHLLLICNHEEGRWQGKIIGRGQVITGRKSLSKGTGLSQQQIRTSLEKLKATSEITIKATNRFSLITVTGYDSYQSRDAIATSKTTSNPPNKQPTDNQQITTNKNLKNLKNLKKLKKGAIFQLPEWVNNTAWLEFEEHRQNIKKPLSDLARSKAIKQLDGFSFEEQQSAIDISIQSRWAGIFPKKLNGASNGQSGKPVKKDYGTTTAGFLDDI